MSATPSNPAQSIQPSTSELVTTLRDMRTPLAVQSADRMESLSDENERLHKRIESVITDRLNVEYAFAMDAKRQTEKENASLKARLEQAERDVYVLERNARVQAKLLADTGRRAEELEGALRRCLSDLITLKPRADTGSARVKQIDAAADRLVAALSPKHGGEVGK